MEKSENFLDDPETNSESYVLPKSKVWKPTIENEMNQLPFKNIYQNVKEYEKEEMKEMRQKDTWIIDFEAEVTTIKPTVSDPYKVNNLLYSGSDGLYHYISYVKPNPNPEEGVEIGLKSTKDGKAQSVVVTPEDTKGLTNFITLKCVIQTEESTRIIEVQHNISVSFNHTFDIILENEKIEFESYRIIWDGVVINRSATVLKYPQIVNGSMWLLSLIYSPVYVYKRFSRIKSNALREVGDRVQALIIIPSEDIYFWGFSMHKKSSGSPYLFTYEVIINGQSVASGDATAGASGKYVDEYFSRFNLPKQLKVKAQQKILLKCVIKTGSSRRSRFSYFAGMGGNKYKKLENEHMGIFEFEDAIEVENRGRTGVRAGMFGEILYKLM